MKVKEETEVGSVGASRTRKWLCWQRWKEKTESRLSVGVGVEAISRSYNVCMRGVVGTPGCTFSAQKFSAPVEAARGGVEVLEAMKPRVQRGVVARLVLVFWF